MRKITTTTTTNNTQYLSLLLSIFLSPVAWNPCSETETETVLLFTIFVYYFRFNLRST